MLFPALRMLGAVRIGPLLVCSCEGKLWAAGVKAVVVGMGEAEEVEGVSTRGVWKVRDERVGEIAAPAGAAWIRREGFVALPELVRRLDFEWTDRLGEDMRVGGGGKRDVVGLWREVCDPGLAGDGCVVG